MSAIEGGYDQSGFVTASTGDQCFVYYYPEEEIKMQLIENGFEVIEVMRKNVPGQDGAIAHEIVFIARKS